MLEESIAGHLGLSDEIINTPYVGKRASEPRVYVPSLALVGHVTKP